MERFQLWTRITLTIVVLNLASTFPASSQGRSAGRTRNSDNTETTTVAPPPTPSPGRDVGRTRQPETNSPRVPTNSNGGERSKRNLPSPVVGNVPPPRPERHPANPAPPYDLRSSPPPPKHCVVVIGGGVPIEITDGVWISDEISFGRDVTLCDERVMPEYSGYDFSEFLKRPYDHPFTDMSVESDSWGDLYVTVRDDTEIMDLGSAVVPVDVIFIPRTPWSADHSVRLAIGHEYVVRTWDGHYAKFLVTSLLNDRVVFDWAYQSGEPWGGVFPAVSVREEGFIRFAR